MESFFSRFKNPLFLIAILLAQTFALAIQIHRPVDAQRPDGPRVRLVRLWTLALVAPFERMTTGTGHHLRAVWANYVDLKKVRDQNRSLQHQIAQLHLERGALAEDALQGQRLRSLLEIQQHYVAHTVIAEVIGTSGSDQSRMLTLDKGWHDGLKPDMAVITPDGIVGKLRDVFPSTSQLLLINDPSSGAGVILQSTRIRAILHGSLQGRILINNLTPDTRIQAGELVLTSGGDQVFPRGLPVGTIESIASDPDHQPYTAIILRPAARLNELEEVLIVTSTNANLSPQTQADLAADALAHNEAHAADISAERLPGLHENAVAQGALPSGLAKSPDPAAPAPEALPPAENSTGLVPKPKPVLHPDRFSPGTAPPANELTPGAPKPSSDSQPGAPKH